MAMCLLGAAEVYKHNKESWRQLQVNAMERDFSWDNAAASYIKLFESLVQ
jgi:starch synthase